MKKQIRKKIISFVVRLSLVTTLIVSGLMSIPSYGNGSDIVVDSEQDKMGEVVEEVSENKRGLADLNENEELEKVTEEQSESGTDLSTAKLNDDTQLSKKNTSKQVEFNSIDGIDSLEKFESALGNADDGDTLVITGNFSISNINIAKSLTIKSSDSNTYILTSEGSRHFNVTGDKKVVFENIVLDGNGAEGGIETSGGEIVLSNVSIKNTTGGALYLTNTTTTINGSTFENNTSAWGGAVFVNNSTVTIKNSNFSANKATDNYYGGAIYIYLGNVTVDASTFSNNLASYGGGAITVDNGASELIVTNSEFSGNEAETLAGAIYYMNGNFTSSNNTFIKNVSEYGGAVYVQDGNIFNDSDSKYISNVGYESGGAIDVRDDAHLYIINSSFFENESDIGGAIDAYTGSNIEVTGGDFSKNKASIITDGNADGGAIHLHSNATLDIKDSTFSENTAYYNGGAISTLDNSTLKITGSKFTNNASTTLKGGAVYVQINTSITLEDNEFSDNKSLQGGAVYAYSSNTFIDENNEYLDNVATNAGGAIFLYHDEDRVTIPTQLNMSGSVFTSNTALSGGAIYIHDNIESVIELSSFTQNKADIGGAIYSAILSDTMLKSSILDGNDAVGKGGAIYLSSSKLDVCGTTVLKNNTSMNGGAIYVLDNSTLSLQDTVALESNIASLDGGAIYTENLANVTADSAVRFLNNKASTAHILIDKDDIELHSIKILTDEYTQLVDENNLLIGFDYAYNNFDINYKGNYPFVVYKIDSKDNQPIKGVTFELKSEDGTFITTGVSDENGLIHFNVDTGGIYVLTEISTHPDYILNSQPIEVTIDGKTGNLSKIIKNEKIIETYQVIYESLDHDGGSVPQDLEKYEENEMVIVKESTMSRDGYLFAGWLYNNEIYLVNDTITMPKGDIVLIAQWIKIDEASKPSQPTSPNPPMNEDKPSTPSTGISNMYSALILMMIGSLLVALRLVINKRNNFNKQ